MSGIRCFAGGNLLRGALCNDHAAAVAALGAEVDDVVGDLDDVHVVLDHDERIAGVGKLLQHLDQTVNVCVVQAGRRLVKDINGLAGRALLQLRRELDALRFTAGERCRGLPDLDITKSDIAERVQLFCDLRDRGEKLAAFLDRHFQYVADRL